MKEDLQEKIKILQQEVARLKKKEMDDTFDNLLKLIFWAVVFVCVFPFFKFGLFLLMNSF